MTTETAPAAEQAAPVAEAVQTEFANFTDPNEPAKTEAPAPAAQAEQPAKPEGEGEQPPAEGAEKTDPPPKKQTAQERIAEITRARREAERREAEALRRAEDAERRLAERDNPNGDGAPAETRTLANGEPDATKYDYGEADPQFIKDLAIYHADRRFEERQQQAERNAKVQEVDRSWEASQDAARSKYADFDEKVWEGAHEGKWACTPVMLEAIKSTEIGGEVAYHLASNPDEARRIAALNPLSQVRELGKLEARLAAPPKTEPPKGKTATDAPPPPDGAARGAGGKFVVADDTDDFTAFRAKHFSP